MENIISLLKDAKRDVEKGRCSGTDQAVYLDCALIYIEGAIEIAQNHIRYDAETQDHYRHLTGRPLGRTE
jgi:hypothetical protein